MHLITDDVVTITITEEEHAEFRVRMPFDNKEWYCMPYKERDGNKIAHLDILGQYQLIEECARVITGQILGDEFPEFDIIMNPVVRSDALAHEIALQLFHEGVFNPRNTVVARKCIPPAPEPWVAYRSATQDQDQCLYLTLKDVGIIKGKKVLVIDDVYAGGGTLDACKSLVEWAGGTVTATAVVAIEEGAKERDNLFYIFELPILKEENK